MSRHKLVKALDLDEELDDFDGGAESEYEEEIAGEDKGSSSFSPRTRLFDLKLRIAVD